MEEDQATTAEAVVEGSPEGELEIVKQAGEQGRPVFEHRVRDHSPANVRRLRTALSSCHWNTQLQVMDLLSLVAPSERQWEVAKHRLLDLINDEDRALGAIVAQVLAPPEKEKEKGS